MTEAKEREASELTRMGVREYRQELSKVVYAEKPVVIERHGEAVGLYIPIKRRNRERQEALLKELNDALAAMRESSGLTEEELAQLIEEELRRPLDP